MTRKLTLIVLLNLLCVCAAIAQTTEFTYQGKLTDSSVPPTASYDFEFRLYDAVSGGTLVGAPVQRLNVAVASGIFTVTLDFGDQFDGTSRFLDISVKPISAGSYTQLSPRSPITSSPYSVKSLNAANATNAVNATNATNATQLGGVAANQFVVTTDPRMTDARTPTAGSANYVQNTAVQQAASNFNISGNGTANIFNAATQFNIAGNRVLSNAGTDNLFAGVNAGLVNTTGVSNLFAGANAGRVNTTGGANSFVGTYAGYANTGGNFNSFVGANAGESNMTGSSNSFFGSDAGVNNTTGSSNLFVGRSAGTSNTTGASNSFFGYLAGSSNTMGGNNTIVGVSANVGSGTLTNATAIGANALVAQNNSLVLGSINGVNGAAADTNVGIGTTAPTQRLHVVGNGLFTGNLTVNGTLNATLPAGSTNYIQNQNAGAQATSNFNISGNGTANIFNATTQFNIAGNRVLSNAGTFNLFAGVGAGQSNTGSANSFVGSNAGFSNTVGSNNSFVGYQAGYANAGYFNSFVGAFAGVSNTTGSSNTIIGNNADVASNNLTNATAIGANASVSQSNSLVLGSINGVNSATADTNVGIGTTSPTTRLQVAGVIHSTTGGIRFPDGTTQTTAALSAVTSVTASGPLASSGGATPNISLTGIVLIANGGTGVTTGAINNSNSLQTANFNISGNGTADIFNATTQFNIGGSRVLSVAGTGNFFGGINAGTANAAGFSNTFVGTQAGTANMTGNNNSFFGVQAGRANIGSHNNSFFGSTAGYANTGSDNSFFGANAGESNMAGGGNSFFGKSAGQANTGGFSNSFFGWSAGIVNTGHDNSFVGTNAGLSNTNGSNNTIIGSGANVASGALTNATAIGANASVSQSNSLVLGSINGLNGATADTNVGIGTTAPTQRLHVVGNGLFTGNLTVNGTFTGNGSGLTNVSAANFSGSLAGDVTGTQAATVIANNAVTTAKLANASVTDAKIVDVAASKITGTLDAARLPNPLDLTGSVPNIATITGRSGSTSGQGVFGFATANTGTTYGVYGASGSTSGSGVFGFATAASGQNFGGRFESASTSGRGVYGYATADTGNAYGVYGQSDSTSGYGVFGFANAATGFNYAVVGQNVSTSGSGVYGWATAGSGTTYGVYGRSNSASGYGGYFQGRGYFSDNVGLGVLNPSFQLQLSTDSAAKPTSGSWTISSDRRLKKNIRTIDGALDQLMRLRGVTYQWKDPASQGDMAGTYTGMIAQDVEKVFPEWIRDDAKGFKTLTVIGFEGIVVEALRQLRAEKDGEISKQQSAISDQQKQIDALKALVCSQNPTADVCKPKN